MNKYGIEFKITTNNLEVFESGSVQINTPDITFKMDSLVFRCVFESDGQPGGHYSGKLENGEFVLKLYNFDNSLGEGISEPLQLATVMNRKLYFLFYISTYASTIDSNQKLREFKYTFLLGGENE